MLIHISPVLNLRQIRMSYGLVTQTDSTKMQGDANSIELTPLHVSRIHHHSAVAGSGPVQIDFRAQYYIARVLWISNARSTIIYQSPYHLSLLSTVPKGRQKNVAFIFLLLAPLSAIAWPSIQKSCSSIAFRVPQQHTLSLVYNSCRWKLFGGNSSIKR